MIYFPFLILLLELPEEGLPLLVVVLAHGLGELLQGLLLLPVEVAGGLDVDRDILVAPAPAVEGGDALALQAEGGAGLGALGDVVLHLAVDGGDLQLGAQHRLGEGDGSLAEDAGPLPAEELVGPDGDGDEKVARGAAVLPGVALTPDGDGLPVVDTGGDAGLDLALAADHAAAPAVLAGLLDDLAPAGY